MIYTASIIGFARTVLIILAIYFGVKIIARLLMPYMLRFAAKKAEQRFGQHFGQQQQQYSTKKGKEGETVIDKMPDSKNKSSNKNVGEYIDYEEID